MTELQHYFLKVNIPKTSKINDDFEIIIIFDQDSNQEHTLIWGMEQQGKKIRFEQDMRY